MNEYIVLLQTGHNAFDIRIYTATSKFRTYGKYRNDGIAISILPNNDENYAYQYGLKLEMENKLNN